MREEGDGGCVGQELCFVIFMNVMFCIKIQLKLNLMTTCLLSVVEDK